jgi:serine/threonine protein phosphatase PrpC
MIITWLAYCILDKVAGDPSCGLFALFDGHGGRQVSDHCAERFPVEIRKEMQKGPSDVCTVLSSAFAKIDNELRLLDSEGCGSTACVILVRREGAHSVLYLANIGDTRCVLSKGGSAERLSVDHRCDNQDEIQRIKSAGGMMSDSRVGGVLAVTRAFGDHSLKKAGVSAIPHVLKYTLKPFDKFLIIASDGVWDSLSDQDAVNYCKEDVSTKVIAQAIVKAALDKGSKDNITCIVLRFH